MIAHQFGLTVGAFIVFVLGAVSPIADYVVLQEPVTQQQSGHLHRLRLKPKVTREVIVDKISVVAGKDTLDCKFRARKLKRDTNDAICDVRINASVNVEDLLIKVNYRDGAVRKVAWSAPKALEPESADKLFKGEPVSLPL